MNSIITALCILVHSLCLSVGAENLYDKAIKCRNLYIESKELYNEQGGDFKLALQKLILCREALDDLILSRSRIEDASQDAYIVDTLLINVNQHMIYLFHKLKGQSLTHQDVAEIRINLGGSHSKSKKIKDDLYVVEYDNKLYFRQGDPKNYQLTQVPAKTMSLLIQKSEGHHIMAIDRLAEAVGMMLLNKPQADFFKEGVLNVEMLDQHMTKELFNNVDKQIRKKEIFNIKIQDLDKEKFNKIDVDKFNKMNTEQLRRN